MNEDIRDKPSAGPEDIRALNFIRAEIPFVLRRHFRQGLRSHVLEVLDPKDVDAEKSGVLQGGILRFPRARPLKMFRVFRTRFDGLNDALLEIESVKVLGRYLAPQYVARSDEFLVHYMFRGVRDLLLCGLQDYVEGEALDPWSPVEENLLEDLWHRISSREAAGKRSPRIPGIEAVREHIAAFLSCVKRMITEAALIPDLAGVSNLILTASGTVKLVDINNISPVSMSPHIPLDDKGYPICDKSVQALALLEQKLLGRAPGRDDPVYRVFLDPERMREVKAVEEIFHLRDRGRW
jgi:hypothetical protein